MRARDELAREQEALTRFHRQRLVRRARSSLEERASFTHDYVTCIFECAECGLLYRSPRPRSDDVRVAYEAESYAEKRLEQLQHSQLASFRRKARELARILPPGARVLEPGSFVGSFLQAAHEVGLSATGLDPSEQLSRRCRALGLRVERATLEEFALGSREGRWDAICIWNTFDQLPDPEAALGAASRLLGPGGQLVLRVPHGSFYRAWAMGARSPHSRLRFPGVAWNNLVGFPYLNGYSLRSLDRLAAAHGFQQMEVAGDTLCTLADDDYAQWARVEERMWKTAQTILCRKRPARAPWIEVRYRTMGLR